MKFKFRDFFKKQYLVLYLIILIGSFLRLQGVFTNSFAFTYDVGRDLLAVYNIVHLHKIPLIGAILGGAPSAGYGIFYGPWWYYFLTPFFIIFSGNPQGIALTMSLVGIATIILGYYFGKKIGNNSLGLLIASVISVSPVMVSLAAQIWNPNISPLFVLCVLFVLIRVYSDAKKGKAKYYFLLGLLLSLIMDLEIVFGLLLSVGIILSVIIILNKKITIKDIGFFIIGELFILSPRIVFDFRHQFLMTKSLLGFFLRGESHQAGVFFNLSINRFGVMFDQFSGTLSANNNFMGVVILLFIIICLAYFYRKSEKVIKDFIKTSIIVVLIFLLGTNIFSQNVWPHYLVGLPVFYILLFSISLYLLGRKISMLPVFIIVIVVFLINLNPISVFQSLTQPIWIGDASVYRNELAVIDYVYGQSHGKSFKYVVYTPPVYDYTYQYLFMWYGPEKYHYSASKQSNLAYFILEPDLQDPSRLVDWLNQRKGDGKIIKSKKLPSGIIIQTRTH